MALLSSCWLIIEIILIPPGLVQKWYCLGFFIHPLLLLLCQIFIWAQFLGCMIWTLLLGPLKSICSALSCILRFIRNSILSMVLQRGTIDHDALNVHGPVRSIVLLDYYRDENIVDGLKRKVGNEEHEVTGEESKFQEYEDSETGRPCFSLSASSSLVRSIEFSIMNGQEESDSSPFLFGTEFPVMDDSSSLASSSEFSTVDRQVENIIEEEDVEVDEVENIVEEEDVEVDEFYEKYNERMRWFDLLNYDRAHGLSAISKEELGSAEPMSTEARRVLIRCLESDFEMVYVGQTCSSWEALHHQYRKVEALASSSTPITGAFFENVSGKFQQFQVMLERFMENERTGAERSWSYVQGRLYLQYLLQVPKVPDKVERENQWTTGRAFFTRELMKVIEASITTFWNFIRSDSKKSPGKLRSLLWINPQVEDPRDLQLFADLTRALHKKELMMRHLNGRRRCCLKRTKPLDELQRLDVLFSSIDMKLVSRVLKMSMISSPQLRWCQDKLANMEFKEGGVARNQSSCLFPPS